MSRRRTTRSEPCSARLRRHHDEQREASGTRVADPVLLARRGAHEVAGGHGALLGADADPARALEHVVELVADRVAVAGLLLPGLEAVRVAEEVRRVDETDLLHLLRRERDEGWDVTEAFHPPSMTTARRAGNRGARQRANVAWRVAARTSCRRSLAVPVSSFRPSLRRARA